MNPQRRSEQETVRQAMGGDCAANEELVASHYSPVFFFLTHLTGDPYTAEELAQETFADAWRKLNRFPLHTSFRSWLMSIAYRLACENRFCATIEAEPNLVHPLVEAALIERTKARLPDGLRIAHIVSVELGLAPADAAKILGIPKSSVLTRLAIRREWLRRHMIMCAIVTSVPGGKFEIPQAEFRLPPGRV